MALPFSCLVQHPFHLRDWRRVTKQRGMLIFVTSVSDVHRAFIPEFQFPEFLLGHLINPNKNLSPPPEVFHEEP